MRMWPGVESAERIGKNGHNPKSAPHTHARIRITSTLAAGGELPERKSAEYSKIVTGKGSERQRDHDAAWGRL